MHFPRIIERHADESAFLWGQRRRAVRSPAFDLPSLTLLDQRLDANLEGLVVAGVAGLHACLSSLEMRAGRSTDQGSELFPALFTAAEIGDTMALARLLVTASRHPRGEEAVISALGWLSAPAAARVLAELSADECPPALRRLAVGGYAARREDTGTWLERALKSDDDGVRSRAFRAVGELGRRDLSSALRAEVHARQPAKAPASGAVPADASQRDGPDPWAIWSLVLFGEESAVPLLFQLAESDSPLAEAACRLVACAAPRAESTTRLHALARGGKWRVALAGAEALGDPACLPWVLEGLETQPDVSRRAMWVYSTITGAVIEPPLALRVPDEDPADEAVIRRLEDPYEDLPAPQIEAIREHWRRAPREFSAGERRIAGRPVDTASLHEVLRTGAQPARAQAAVELTRTAARTSVFSVRAPGFAQTARLARERSAEGAR